MKQTLSSRRVLCISLLLIGCALASAQPGNLNTSFGTNGFRFTKVGDQNKSQASTYNVLINENADTYSVMGLAGNLLVYKRDGDGLPVTNYGDAGFSDIFSFGERANTLLPDGSVLFAGFAGIKPSFNQMEVTGNLVLGKLNKYGKWDQNFGPGGLKTLFPIQNYVQAIGLGVMSNGGLLVVLRDFLYQASKLTLVRLLPSGDIDPSLPDNGRLVLPFGEAEESIDLPTFTKQPDNKWILGVRETPTGPGTVQNYLVRLNANGTLDATFGSGGIKNLDSYIPSGEELVAVGCKKEGGYTLLTSSTGNSRTLRVSHFTAAGIPDASKGGVSPLPVNLPFTSGLRSAVFDDLNKFSLLVVDDLNINRHILIRLDATGKPDLTFNQVGYYELQPPYNTVYTGLAITIKKNLMVLGNSYIDPNTYESPYSFLLQKILAKGQPDPFYDGDGTVFVNYPYANLKWTQLLKISDTKMIAGGFVSRNGKPYWLMEAVNEQGKRDLSFANGRSVLVPLPADATTYLVNMEQTNNGQIIVYGSTNTINQYADKIFLYKYFTDGRRDISWASNGQKLLTTGSRVGSIEVITQKDGKILVAYSARRLTGTTDWDISIQRLLPNGNPDMTFGYSGSRLIDIRQTSDWIDVLRLQEDGKIILVSQTGQEMNHQLSVVRLLPDGRYDPTYQQGLKLLQFPTEDFIAHDAIVREDNKLLIAGNYGPHYTTYYAALVQLNANGSFDRSFATNGFYQDPLTNEQAAAVDVNMQSDGKLLLTCYDFGNYMADIVNHRLYGNGQPDPSFGVNGESRHSVSLGWDEPVAAKLFPGQLVIAGGSPMPFNRGMLMSIQVNNLSTFKLAGTEPTTAALLVYPNPAKEQITVQWSGAASTATAVQLYDLEGKLLQAWQAQNFKGMAQQQLQLSNHAAGSYLLRVIFADGSTRQEKIVIVR